MTPTLIDRADRLAVQLVPLHMLRAWLAGPRFEPGHVHPAWFIPVAGNLAVPLAVQAGALRKLPFTLAALTSAILTAARPGTAGYRFGTPA